MPSIKTTQTDTEIIVQFPFALRDAFRTLFKTCPWDGGKRAYLVKNTTANRNKLARFAAEAETVLAALAAAEEADATVEELARMRERFATVRATKPTRRQPPWWLRGLNWRNWGFCSRPSWPSLSKPKPSCVPHKRPAGTPWLRSSSWLSSSASRRPSAGFAFSRPAAS
ncbi:hypothetical protein [Cupriavidus necator]